jgi:hypothetical protein
MENLQRIDTVTVATVTVKKLQVAFARAYTTSKGHNKTAYKFALQLLSNAPKDLIFTVRKNVNLNAYNIGDVSECLVKHYFTHDKELSYSLANESDISRNVKNEVKTFSNANRYPNGFASPQGFIAVSEYGIHYITKAMCKAYWSSFRDYKGIQKQPTKAILKEIIDNEQPKLLKGLTSAIVYSIDNE